jgi:shikimate dehydrogenase
MTRTYAIIGDPVAHSLSPVMQNAAFAAAGIAATYEAMRVTAAGVSPAIASARANHAGLNVTTPLKETVLPHMDALTSAAAAIRAVNAVRIDRGKMTGHNTDGAGLLAAIFDLWRVTPHGMSVCILGSGPAGRAIANALAGSGVARLTCWSRNAVTSAEIGAPPDAAPDLLVSALPAGTVVPPSVLKTVAATPYAFDINYAEGTCVLPAEVGTHRSDGLPMLVHQGAIAFEWWTGVPAPLDAMRNAVGLAPG